MSVAKLSIVEPAEHDLCLTRKSVPQVNPILRLVRDDDGYVPSHGLDHLQRIIDSPHHDTLSCFSGIIPARRKGFR